MNGEHSAPGLGHGPTGLTRLQRDCFWVIEELTATTGFCPSFREIQHELGLASISEVARLVAALETRDWISRRPGHARSLIMTGFLPLPAEPVFVGFFDDAALAAQATEGLAAEFTRLAFEGRS